MNFFNIKWENIFTIIIIIAIGSLSVKYVFSDNFDLNIFVFTLLFVAFATTIVRWCTKMSRKFYLSK